MIHYFKLLRGVHFKEQRDHVTPWSSATVLDEMNTYTHTVLKQVNPQPLAQAAPHPDHVILHDFVA